VIRKRTEESGEGWSCMIAGRLTLLFTFVLLLGTAFAAPRTASKDVKSTGGWRCNAYGKSGSWYTYTGTPKPTKDAAQRDVIADCRKDAIGCQPSGCWPVDPK
jgi:hypothetical protein